MEYAQGSIGRIFVARLEEGEELYPRIEELARKENIRAGLALCLGGLRSAGVVTGPEDPDGPIVAHVESFHDAREFMGVGTIFWDESGPSLHLHAGIGRGKETLVGCPREGASVFLINEVTVIEICGIESGRVLDPSTGFHLLKLFGTPAIS